MQTEGRREKDGKNGVHIERGDCEIGAERKERKEEEMVYI